MIEAYFTVVLIVIIFVSVVAIYAKDQHRKVTERAVICEAMANALYRVPSHHAVGANWLAEQVQKELVRAGWEPFP